MAESIFQATTTFPARKQRRIKRPRRDRLPGETRPMELIHEHYVIEKDLATRLRDATAAERPSLYQSVYGELFERIPHHPQLTRQRTPEARHQQATQQFQFVSCFLKRSDHLLEVGAGDCAFSKLASGYCDRVTAVDVADICDAQTDWPENVTFQLLPEGRLTDRVAGIDLAYSNQLMEHLHPEDAVEQLRGIYAALRRGGRYVCITPNSVAGPWDISAYYDEVATGLHLKEYRLRELTGLLLAAGFDRVHCYAGGRGWFARVPHTLVRVAEFVLKKLPYGMRSRLSRSLPVRGLLGLRLVAFKDQ